MTGTATARVITTHVQTPSYHRKAAFRPAQRRVFGRLRKTGICRARACDALVGNRRPRSRRPFRAAENPVATAGGGPAAGTGDAGAAGRGPDGAGNPARFRCHFAAGQPLLRLERGGTTGAAAGAAVAPGPGGGLPRTPPAGRREKRGDPYPAPRT